MQEKHPVTTHIVLGTPDCAHGECVCVWLCVCALSDNTRVSWRGYNACKAAQRRPRGHTFSRQASVTVSDHLRKKSVHSGHPTIVDAYFTHHVRMVISCNECHKHYRRKFDIARSLNSHGVFHHTISGHQVLHTSLKSTLLYNYTTVVTSAHFIMSGVPKRVVNVDENLAPSIFSTAEIDSVNFEARSALVAA